MTQFSFKQFFTNNFLDMKTKQSFTNLLLLLAALGLSINLVLSSCSKKEQEAPDLLLSTFYLGGNKVVVRNQVELNGWVEQYLHDGTIIQTTEFRYSDEGKFYYLYSKGTKGNLLSTIGIPINLDSTSEVVGSRDNGGGEGGCTHRCDQASFNPCSTCDLVIHEKCKSQSCTCKTGTGSCDGSINFIE